MATPSRANLAKGLPRQRHTTLPERPPRMRKAIHAITVVLPRIHPAWYVMYDEMMLVDLLLLSVCQALHR